MLYHNNSPRWSELLKLPIPVDKFRGSHIRFEFRHCSSKCGSGPRTPRPRSSVGSRLVLCLMWADLEKGPQRREEGKRAVGVLEVRGPTPGETGTEKEEKKGESLKSQKAQGFSVIWLFSLRIRFIMYNLENLNRRGRHSIRQTMPVWWAWAILTFRKLTQLREAPLEFSGRGRLLEHVGEAQVCVDGAVLGDGKMTDNVCRERLQIEQLSRSADLKSSGQNRAACPCGRYWSHLQFYVTSFAPFTSFSSPFSAPRAGVF